MEQMQNQQFQQAPQEPPKENFFNKRIIIIIAAIIVLLLISFGVWYWQVSKIKERTPYMPGVYVSPPVEIQEQAPQDTTAAINNELNVINVESVDESFKEIDADLNSL